MLTLTPVGVRAVQNNFGEEKSLLSPNWRDQIDSDTARLGVSVQDLGFGE